MAKDFTLAPSGTTVAKAEPTKGETLRQRAFIVGIVVAVMWGLEVIDVVLGQRLNSFGIEPRTATGLIGIPLAPFLHSGFGHLIANTIPFVLLGLLTVMRGVATFFIVSAFVTVVGGLAVWLMASSGYHIGASGLVFGLFGYNLAMAIFERSFKSIVMAVLVGLLYAPRDLPRVPTDRTILLARWDSLLRLGAVMMVTSLVNLSVLAAVRALTAAIAAGSGRLSVSSAALNSS